MSPEDFDMLATKVIAGEASPEEQTSVREATTHNPALQQRLNELKALRASVRETLDAAEALDGETAPFPEYRMAELRGSVRKAFPRTSPSASWLDGFAWLRRPAFAAVVCVLAVLLGGVWVVERPGSGVEFGEFSEMGVTRGAILRGVPHVRCVAFREQRAFETWRGSPFGRGIGTRAWLNAEGTVLRIVSKRWFRGESVREVPLPSDDLAREQKLCETLQELGR